MDVQEGAATTTNQPEGGAQSATNPTQAPQAQSLGWRAALAPDLQNHPELVKYKGPNDLAKDFLGHLERSANSIPKLKEGASEEERKAYLAALGVPDAADGYELKAETTLPAPELESFSSWYRETAHKAGIPKDAAKALFAEMVKRAESEQANAKKVVETTRAQGEEALKKEWGAEYPRRLQRAKALVAKGGDDFVKVLEETGLINDPRMARAIDFIGNLVSEDLIVSGHSDPTRAARTREKGLIRFANTPGMDK